MKNMKQFRLLFFVFVMLCGSWCSQSHAQVIESKQLMTVSGIACSTPPRITCPSDFSSCPGADTNPINTGFASAQPGAVDCDTPLVSFKDSIISSGPCSGAIEIQRTWTAVDPTDPLLMATCVQNILLSDTIPPMIMDCPKDTMVTADSTCFASVSWIAPSVFDNCGRFFLTVSHISGDKFPIGTTTVTYTAEDECLNSSTCSFTITVTGNCCSEPPNIVCPADYVGCPLDSIDPGRLGFASGTPGSTKCDTPKITFIDSVISAGPCVGATTIARIWRASDPINPGLFSECIQNITLSDTIAPVIISCPKDTVLQPGASCSAIYTWAPILARDNCGIQKMESSHNSGDTFPSGTTMVTVTVFDGCELQATCSFSITVESNCCDSLPIVTCPRDFEGCPGIPLIPAITGSPSFIKPDSTCPDPVFTYSDDTTSTGPCSGGLEVTRTWISRDTINDKFIDTCYQNITLIDTTPPAFRTCPTDTTVMSDSLCMAIVSWITPMASDKCGAPTVTSTHSPGDTFAVGTTTVEYSAIDKCGNEVICSFDVTVNPNCCHKPPVLECPKDYKGCPMTSIEPKVTGKPTATKGGPQCGEPTLSYKDNVISKGPCHGAKEIERTWYATDSDNPSLVDSCVQKIILVDDEPPVFKSCPQDVTINASNACEAKVHWIVPIATDNCQWFSVTSSHDPGDTFGSGTTTVTYKAEDDCGNITKCSFDVTVNGKGFKLDCPNDIYIQNPDYPNGHVVHFNPPTVTNCGKGSGGCPNHITGFIYMGERNGSKYFCSLSQATWTDAKRISESVGGTLAVINDAAENNYLVSKLMGATAFIGYSDENSEGNFEWCDGTPKGYENWHLGQPNNHNGEQDYVEILNDGTWNDQYGYVKREFVCEVKCSSSVKQIAGPPSGAHFPCGKTRVTFVADNGKGLKDTCSFNVHVNCQKTSIYCKSLGVNSQYTYIDRIKFADLDHTSGDNLGYADFTHECANIKQDGMHDICLKPGFRGGPYLVYWRIWIDYNQDGDFEDASEFVAQGKGDKEICGKITIPSWVPTGKTQMRVSMSHGGYCAGPCAIFSYGEVEDYCIMIGKSTFTGNTTGLLESDDVKEDQTMILLPEGDSEISNANIQIFPNPATHNFTITTSGLEINRIHILDASGQVILSQSERESSTIQVATNGWSNGTYFIQIYDKNGFVSMKRILIIK